MARRRREPQWLGRTVIDAIQNDQVREHGGLAGVRDENGLEAALARPRQKWHYDAAVDLPTLAAAYAFGLITNHPYRDGNKRIGFMAMVTSLELHGLTLTATDAEVVDEVLAVASGTLSEAALTDWVRKHSSKTS
jgi:death-on-curing protein